MSNLKSDTEQNQVVIYYEKSCFNPVNVSDSYDTRYDIVRL